MIWLVSQKRLDHRDVRAGLEQVRGEAVEQQVWLHALAQPRVASRAVQRLAHGLRRDGSHLPAREEVVLRTVRLPIHAHASSNRRDRTTNRLSSRFQRLTVRGNAAIL